MKKMVSVLCAAVLSLSMTVAVFAQPSPQVSGVAAGVSSATDADGNAVDVKVGSVPAEYQSAVDEIKNIDKVKELLGSAFVDGMQVVDVKDVTVPDGTVFPVTISFNVTGVKADSKVAVLHYDTAAKAWEVVESKAGNGTVTATFNSLSPVAFVVDGNSAAGGATASESNTSGNNTSVNSPKTGESSVLMMTVAVAAVALLGMGTAVIRSRKRA